MKKTIEDNNTSTGKAQSSLDVLQLPLKIGTLFSGIGAFEEALKQLNIPHEIIFACDNGERYLKKTYEEILEFINQRKEI